MAIGGLKKHLYKYTRFKSEYNEPWIKAKLWRHFCFEMRRNWEPAPSPPLIFVIYRNNFYPIKKKAPLLDYNSETFFVCIM